MLFLWLFYAFYNWKYFFFSNCSWKSLMLVSAILKRCNHNWIWLNLRIKMMNRKMRKLTCWITIWKIIAKNLICDLWLFIVSSSFMCWSATYKKMNIQNTMQATLISRVRNCQLTWWFYTILYVCNFNK